MKKDRFQLLDTIRGIMLVSMVIYHAAWNFVYIYGMDWAWYKSYGAYIWQQSICWTFILLSGFCFSLGKRHLKSGLTVFFGGALVTAVTLIVMPGNRVVFGVLTCIGSCILILALTENVFRKIPAEMGMVLSLGFFLIMKNINDGYLGIGGTGFWELPKGWYQNYFTTYLGFPFRGFFSTDYFSLLPWLFLFITGFYFYEIFEKYDLLKQNFLQRGIRLFSFMGRHSLLIYLLHQPVIYGVQELCHSLHII